MGETDVLAGDGKGKRRWGVSGEGPSGERRLFHNPLRVGGSVRCRTGRNVCFTSCETIVDCSNTDS